MSTPRALANQKLYHARIIIDYWRKALQDEQIPASVLAQAFGTAVCNHLAEAYGWFLLVVAQPAEIPLKPPLCCADLPPLVEGKEIPPEIREFQQLESDSWLTGILSPLSPHTDGKWRSPAQHTPENLALVSEQGFGPEEAEQWHSQLNSLFERMSDSLEEY